MPKIVELANMAKTDIEQINKISLNTKCSAE